jgi:hypothetical protein
MKIRNKAAAIGASVALGVGGALVATPASAAAFIDICVSSNSDTGVYAYSLTSGYRTYVAKGYCAYNLGNGSNQIRVDTISNGSYKKTLAGAGWDVTCVDGRNTASNPSGDRMYYRTWILRNCE